MSIDTIIDCAFALAVLVHIVHSHNEINSLHDDIRDLNRIIKRLQVKNGMRADGIDKAG